jgi:hypothetical protein
VVVDEVLEDEAYGAAAEGEAALEPLEPVVAERVAQRVKHRPRLDAPAVQAADARGRLAVGR